MRAILVLCCFLISGAAASAAGPTGLYVAPYDDGILSLDLTSVGSEVSGNYQFIEIDPRSPKQVSITKMHVSGTVNDTSMTLDIVPLADGPSYHWKAAYNYGGILSVSIPQPNGHISEAFFSRASMADLNEMIDRLPIDGAATKARESAESHLLRMLDALKQDVGARAAVAARMTKARADAAAARKAKHVAELALAEQQKIAAHKHQAANAEVAAARDRVHTAQYIVEQADRASRDARLSLAQLDAEIAKLRVIVAQEQSRLYPQ